MTTALDRPASTAREVLPLLPLRNTVLFPYVFTPLVVGRPDSVAAVEAALSSEEKMFVCVAQRNPDVDEPGLEDLYRIGTKVVIKRMTGESGEFHMLIQGIERVQLEELVRSDLSRVTDGTATDLLTDSTQPRAFLEAVVTVPPVEDDPDPTAVEALRRSVLDLVAQYADIVSQGDAVEKLLQAAPLGMQLAFLLASIIQLDFEQEQTLLEAKSHGEALRLIHEYLAHELQIQELRHRMTDKARGEVGRDQREYFLRQQLKAIQEELGEVSPEKAETTELRRRLDETDLPDDVRKEADRELKRLEHMPAAAPDHQMTRGYLELICELPWTKETIDEIDIAHARSVLDDDHFGLEDVKDRIIEHLAVLWLNPQAQSPILCFVGPPGVGKTSLGQSIARAIGREFERLSLGGLHDESELRGHRRTYIGAMPGRIIQAIRRAGVRNPLLMLDEVDKLGRDFRGDPASALMEILDPAQNLTFHDNYLNLPFDLSHVFFITTANTLDSIPRPLLDRMEVIRLPGYTEEEKLEIAKRYLVPRQVKDAGLTADQAANGPAPRQTGVDLLAIPDETLREVIRRWTREAGVRQLERAVGRLARKTAVRVAAGEIDHEAGSAATAPWFTVPPEQLPDLLGPETHRPEHARQTLSPGVAIGLAWTEAGGDILYVEATILPQGRDMRLTGQLGEVMRESAQAAQSYVWSHAADLDIDVAEIRRNGLHIHVPAGAVPKDGPSAGVAIVAALISVLTGRPVRSDTAMTGEITLTGQVLPIGGVKEKVLAARGAGLKRVILPQENRTDLREIPPHAQSELEFVFVESIDDVVNAVLPRETPGSQASAIP